MTACYIQYYKNNMHYIVSCPIPDNDNTFHSVRKDYILSGNMGIVRLFTKEQAEKFLSEWSNEQFEKFKPEILETEAFQSKYDENILFIEKL